MTKIKITHDEYGYNLTHINDLKKLPNKFRIEMKGVKVNWITKNYKTFEGVDFKKLFHHQKHPLIVSLLRRKAIIHCNLYDDKEKSYIGWTQWGI